MTELEYRRELLQVAAAIASSLVAASIARSGDVDVINVVDESLTMAEALIDRAQGRRPPPYVDQG